ncbi:MAG: hypothetical protein ACKV2V_02045 [Blastocatellia bacterium]
MSKTSSIRTIWIQLLSLLLIATLAIPATAATDASPESAKKEEARFRMTEKVKEGVVKLGTGADARIEVRLRDKTKVKGWISEIGEEHFMVTSAKTGAATRVAYPDVSGVKGNNLSTGAAIAIGAAIGAGVALLVLWAIFASLD